MMRIFKQGNGSFRCWLNNRSVRLGRKPEAWSGALRSRDLRTWRTLRTLRTIAREPDLRCERTGISLSRNLLPWSCIARSPFSPYLFAETPRLPKVTDRLPDLLKNIPCRQSCGLIFSFAVLCYLPNSNERRRTNNWNTDEITIRSFSRLFCSGKRQNTEQKPKFWQPRLDNQTYSVCVVFAGIGVPPEHATGYVFFCSETWNCECSAGGRVCRWRCAIKIGNVFVQKRGEELEGKKSLEFFQN